MKTIKAVFMIRGERTTEEISNWFIASVSPLYLGIISKPSPGLWAYLSHSSGLIIEINDESFEFRITYRIEVGENSIFFVTHSGVKVPRLAE